MDIQTDVGKEDEFNDHMDAALAISDALFAVNEENLTSGETIGKLAIDINNHLKRARDLHDSMRNHSSQSAAISELKP